MLSLEGIEEYNNAAALYGLEGLEDNPELLGKLMNMNPVKRKLTVNRLTTPAMQSRGSRAEMEKLFAELPPHIRAALLNRELRLADTWIYSIKPVSSKTIKMFETQDDKQTGLRNISNAKLPKNQAMVVSGIVLLAGVAADATTDNVIATQYTGIESKAAIANGEFSLKANKKQIVPEGTSNGVFKTDKLTTVPAGYFKLANPRIIADDVLIELTVELGTMTGVAAFTHLFVGLHGTITTP